MNADDKKKLGVIILAVAAGIVAAILAGNYIKDSVQNQTASLAKEYEKKRKQEMDVLRQDYERFKVETAQAVSQQAQALAVTMKGQQGHSVPTVTQPAKPMSLAIKTPAGKRAMTIQLDSLSAVGGMISAGDYVDVLAHLNVPNPSDPNGKPDIVTVMAFQNLQVLAVGTILEPVLGQYQNQQAAPALNVTFAVDPQEAGLMTFAQKNGKLQLVLRSPEETEGRMLQAASWQTLSDYILEKQGTDISAPKSKALIEPAVEEVKPFIQIFRGGREL